MVSKITTPPSQVDLVDKVNEIIDGKQDTLVSGTNIKTIGGNSLLGSGNIDFPTVNNATLTITQGGVSKGTFTANASSNVTIDLDSGGSSVDTANLSYYGTCATAAATQAKVVVCEGFVLKEGASIRVKFTNTESYNGGVTLNVNDTGAIYVKSVGTTNNLRYCWLAGEIVSFTYDGTNWVMEDAGIASTSYYGYTKLTTSATSTSSEVSLTPVSLNNLVQNMIEPYPVYSASNTYEVGDRVRYSYQAWECITAITTAEAWTAGHWKEINPIQTQIDNLTSNQVTSVNNIQPVNGNVTLTGYQTTSNLVTSVSSSSTDSQYPSAKLFYDTCGNIETLINAL